MSQESSPKGETDGTRPRQRSTAIKLSSDNKSNKFACCFVVTKNKIQMPLVFHVKICLPQGKSKTWTTERKHTRQNEVKPKNGINTCDDWGVNLNLRLWEGKIRPPVTYNHVRRSSVRRLTQLFPPSTSPWHAKLWETRRLLSSLLQASQYYCTKQQN